MPEKNKLSAKERLIGAAIDNMWHKNFVPTGVEQLCQAAGVTKGSFYHFFTSKNELAVAAVERLWQDTKEQIFLPIFTSDMFNWSNKFKELIAKNKEIQSYCIATRGAVLGCPFGNLGQEMAVQDETIRIALERIFLEQQKYFEETLAAAEATGEIPSGNTKRKAEAILALIQGANLMARIYNDGSIFEGLENDVLALAIFSYPMAHR